MAMAEARESEGKEAITANFQLISLGLEEDPTAEGDFVSSEEKEEVFVVVEEEEEEFAFAIPSLDPSDRFQVSSAEEIFFNGQIRSLYSITDLGFRIGEKDSPNKEIQPNPIEERKIASASCSTASELLEGVSADSYCLWNPNSAPDLRRRSNSAGESKRWRLRDLVIGRSHSDGKKKFIFLDSNEKKVPEIKEEKKKKVVEMDMATAHRLFYSKPGVAPSGDRRKSYLPYRSHLVGLFGGSQPF